MENTEMTSGEILAYLNENGLYPDDCSSPIDSAYLSKAVYDITITCGDWKHDHGFLDHLMEQKGYYKTREDLIHDEWTDDGDDCYSSRHRFVFKPYYELFNGRVA